MNIGKTVRKATSLDSTDKLKIFFPNKPFYKVLDDAIRDHNKRRVRFGQTRNIVRDKSKLSKARRDKLVLNYLRHDKTNYDKIQRGTKTFKSTNITMMHNKIEKAARKKYHF